MTRQLLSLITMLLLVVGMLALAVNTPFVFMLTVPSAAAPRLAEMGFQMRDFKIGRQSLKLPHTLTLQDVSFVIDRGETSYAVALGRVVFPDARQFWNAEAPVQIGLGRIRLDSPSFKVEEAKVMMALTRDEARGWRSVDGIFQEAELSFQGYALSGLQGKFKWNHRQVQITDASAAAYEGSVTGQVNLIYAPEESVLLWLEMADVVSEKITGVDHPVLNDVEGVVSGTVRVSDNNEQDEIVDIQMNFPQGGKIRGDLFKRLAGSLDPDQRAALPATDSFSFEAGAVRVISGRNRQLQLTLQAVNRTARVALEKTWSVKMEDGWMPFLFGRGRQP